MKEQPARRDGDLEPLEVESLLSDDQRRLEIATGSSRPIPAGELEELLSELRRIDADGGGRKP